jgi:hypothetical protein
MKANRSRMTLELEPSALALEEALQEVTALLGHQPADDFGAMVQPGISKEIVNGAGHAIAVIVGPKNDPADFGQHDGARALGARLQRDVHGRHEEPILSDILKRPLECQQFCVRGGIITLYCFIVRLAHDLSVGNHNRSNRHLLTNRGRPCQPKGGLHPREITG